MNKQGGEKIEKVSMDRGFDTQRTSNKYYDLATATGLLKTMSKINEIIDYLNHAKTK